MSGSFQPFCLFQVVRNKPHWLGDLLSHSTIEALLLKFACSVDAPLVMGYIDLVREVLIHTAQCQVLCLSLLTL
jgi:hypothetical protein